MRSEDKIALEEYLRADPHWIDRVKELYIDKVFEGSTATQNIHTPDSLCREIVGKLREHCELKGKKILTLNPEFVTVLGNEDGLDITFVSDCPKKNRYVSGFYPNVKIVETDFLKWENNMKTFDVCIMNPPYQKNGEGKGSDNVLWPHFIQKGIELLKLDGYLGAISPSGWREPNIGKNNLYKRIGAYIRKHDILFVEIHNQQDGMKAFGCGTRYDWYIIRNSKSNIETVVKGEDGTFTKINTEQEIFIPNFSFDVFRNLIAKESEQKVSMISDSTYHIRDCIARGTMSKEKDEIFKYPCVRYVSEENGFVDLYYSNVNRGHFGIPKVIFGNQAAVGKIIVDETGEYGLTQFVTGLTAKTTSELYSIKKAMETEHFKKIMAACRFTTQSINKNILSLFKKDFWKEFI